MTVMRDAPTDLTRDDPVYHQAGTTAAPITIGAGSIVVK
jgi:hypothetical protein